MDEDAVRRLIGSRISLARTAANMSQVDLATALGVTSQTISRWERGVRSPDGMYLLAMTKLLHCSADFLVGNSDTLHVSRQDKEHAES